MATTALPHHPDQRFNGTHQQLSEQDQADHEVERIMEAVVHASSCVDQSCPLTNCKEVKELFSHAIGCPWSITGGCRLCRRMWWQLQVHAKGCNIGDCPVPRCRKLRMEDQELEWMMASLVHASSCHNESCPETNCNKVKSTFSHAIHCPRSITGGCQRCRRMWWMLQVHAKGCNIDNCPVPRCRKLEVLRRRPLIQQDEESRVA